MLKNLPAVWETWVQSLGWEDPLEEDMATRSSILAWKIPRTEEPGGYGPWGRKESDTTKHAHTHKTSGRCMSLWSLKLKILWRSV